MLIPRVNQAPVATTEIISVAITIPPTTGFKYSSTNNGKACFDIIFGWFSFIYIPIRVERIPIGGIKREEMNAPFLDSSALLPEKIACKYVWVDATPTTRENPIANQFKTPLLNKLNQGSLGKKLVNSPMPS
ncbi:MAG: hypothetical protein H0S78_05415 [Tissierellales bacterium]|nr:hypothetical protein [Tissierellales bacterium]